MILEDGLTTYNRLFSGAMTGNGPPSTSICIAQSGLYASQSPLLAYSMLSYSLNVRIPSMRACSALRGKTQLTFPKVLFIIPPPSMLMGTVATSTMTVLLLLPFLTFTALGIVSALVSRRPGRACTPLITLRVQIASQSQASVSIHLLYCFLDQNDV